MKPVIAWNTGCHYTAHGQIICAQVQEDGVVLFADLSRMIDGRIKSEADPFLTIKDLDDPIKLRDFVMYRYLRNQYDCGLQSSYFYGRVHNTDRAAVKPGDCRPITE